MASQGFGWRQPLPSSFSRQPDGEVRWWAASLLSHIMDVFERTGRLRLVLLPSSPLLALEEAEPGPTGRTQPLFLGGRSWHQLALDVQGFSAEELTVQLEGRKLTVLGKQEKAAGSAGQEGYVCRESRQMRKELLLPPDAHLEALTCALHPDGQLRVHVPRLERTIPVTVERSPGESDGGAEDPSTGGEKADGQ